MRRPKSSGIRTRVSTMVAGLLLALPTSQYASTIVWNAASGAGTNWSTGNNWVGNAAPGGGDDVKFFDTGTNGTAGVANSFADGSFGGYIGSLTIGNTNGVHTIAIATGTTLSITNGNLNVGTPTDPLAARNLTNTITGAGASLLVSNSTANISINQTDSVASPSRANLNLSGLDNFTVNANRIGIGDGQFPGVAVNNRAGGNLILAKTNNITLAYTDTLANYLTNGKSSAIVLSRNSGNNPGITSLLQLGIQNTFNVDSMDFGMDKSGNNTTAAHGIMTFNPAFAGQNQVANFYGVSGPGSRVSWWSVGDGNSSSSTSNGGGGTNDFSLGTVNAFVNVMSLARDAASASDTWAGPHKGVFTYTNGTVDVNTLTVGNQYLESGTSTAPALGIFNVVGSGATLKVNTLMTLGTSTLATAAGSNTQGFLNITNGSAFVNNLAVGTYSISNIVNIANGSLTVSNTLATNASGLFALNMSNSTLGVTVAANSSIKGLVRTLNTTGTNNQIKLDPAPVIFSSYPQQVPLIRYTTWNGSNTFTLTSVPAWAPGATIVSNAVNKTVDLSLPLDPRPVFTASPGSYSGNVGDNIPSTFIVSISSSTVLPVSYQWYYVNGGVTNALTDGAGPGGSSTISGTTTTNLQILNAQGLDSGSYFVVASNAYATVASSAGVLTISSGGPPFVSGPTNATVIQGNNANFSAVVAANPAATISWYTNGTLVGGATSSSLSINNVQYPANDAESVCIVASNSFGIVTNCATLTVIVTPTISSQPTSLIVTNTQSAALSVTASGVPAPTYQWYKNSNLNPIANATNATYSIGSASPSDTATYFVTVANAAGSLNSSNASITVNSTMVFTALTPSNGQTGVCYDTPLYITFDRAPSIRTAGKIKIFNVTNAITPVDTIDMTLGTLQSRTIATEGFSTYPIIVTGNQAAIFPHLGVLTSNQTYYVTIDDGVLTDSTGAFFAGISGAGTWQFTTKTTGAANPTNILVAADGSGDFNTVQGALDSLATSNPSPILVNVKDGVYTEVVEFKKSNVVLRGQSRSGTIVGYANNSLNNGSTHSRMAMKVNANDIALDNLTVTNMTPQGGSQAEALMIETGAARILVNNCKIASYQDTILANTATSKAYFNNSLIQGDVDFIWGGGNLFFTNCEIRYLFRAGNGSAQGPNPSPQASEVTSNQFSFVNCAFTTPAGATNDLIGRTRGIIGANMVMINCFVSTNLNSWAADALPTSNFKNIYSGCTNDLGAPATLNNGISYPTNDPYIIGAASAPVWLYGWSPTLLPNILTQPASLSVAGGASAGFSVVATGVGDPTYQWNKNGSPISGATGSSYGIANAYAGDAANYTVVVTTGAGSVTSSAAALTVGNTAPSLNAYSNINSGVGANVSVSSTATDPDVPTQSLSFSLLAPPVGATINPSTGLISWRPTVTDSGSIAHFTVVVADNGTPSLSATNSFDVTVASLSQPVISGATVTGAGFSFSFSGDSGPDYAVQSTTDLTSPATWTTILRTNSPVMPFSFTDTNATSGQMFYRIIVGPPLP